MRHLDRSGAEDKKNPASNASAEGLTAQ